MESGLCPSSPSPPGSIYLPRSVAGGQLGHSGLGHGLGMVNSGAVRPFFCVVSSCLSSCCNLVSLLSLVAGAPGGLWWRQGVGLPAGGRGTSCGASAEHRCHFRLTVLRVLPQPVHNAASDVPAPRLQGRGRPGPWHCSEPHPHSGPYYPQLLTYV